MKSGEANLALRGKAGGDRLNSGYWFRNPPPTAAPTHQYRRPEGRWPGGQHHAVRVQEEPDCRCCRRRPSACSPMATWCSDVSRPAWTTRPPTRWPTPAPKNPPAAVVKVPERTIDTTLSAERLIARVLTPERMSIVTLLDYVDAQQPASIWSQVVALWRKLAYPFDGQVANITLYEFKKEPDAVGAVDGARRRVLPWRPGAQDVSRPAWTTGRRAANARPRIRRRRPSTPR